ncbi:MAG TPA: hypothetical protein VE487_05020 [Ilumatobacter sp.]|nr:hypothetical protein [Ilumatobacter sp.]
MHLHEFRAAPRTGLAAAANAITIAIAAALFDKFTINALPYIVAVVMFTPAGLLIKPFADRMAGEYPKGAMWVGGLVATYVALLLADILSDGIQIDGVGTWIIATLIVWAGTLLYDMVVDKVIAAAQGCLSGTGRSPP